MTSQPSLTVSVIVPTIGRPSLSRLLASLDAADGPAPDSIVVVDDRGPRGSRPLPVPESIAGAPVILLSSGGRGPAAARNRGAREVSSDWLAFLDDDVVVSPDWFARLHEDLGDAVRHGAAGSQGAIDVPQPSHRRPTDWERDVSALSGAAFATADLAYRRDVFFEVGGFDEGFTRAYREDADLALRVRDASYLILKGRRRVQHPVGPAGPWISIERQRSNASDARMRAKHGRRWRPRSQAPRGRLPVHIVTVGAAATAVIARVFGLRRVSAAAALTWAALTAQFSWARIAPGPRTSREIARMALTSVVIPPAAVFHRARGTYRESRAGRRIDAVLFDRDGTLVVDVPFNGDPSRVQPVPGAAAAVGRLRAAALRTGVVSNQSGVALGLITPEDVTAVNARLNDLVGPLGGWWCCLHGEDEGCECRKPAPGLVVAAARASGSRVSRCVVVGDTGGDVAAAEAAGARSVLVPNDRTRTEEVAVAPAVAGDINAAVDYVIDLAVGR